MSRFDYVKYDDHSFALQGLTKDMCMELEKMIETIGSSLDPMTDKSKVGRSKALALTALEECYMWIGKAIRDDQNARTKVVVLEEDRHDG